MKDLLTNFPMQVAFPERITVFSMSEFFEIVNKYNGIKSKMYFSLYNCTDDGRFINPIIDKIAFDLDYKGALESARKLSKYCMDNNLKHTVIFSTGGFWVYIKSKEVRLDYPKDALKNIQHDIAKRVGLSIGEPKDSDIDHHIIGDIARVSRMPGTLDVHRQLYAQSITQEMLQLTLEEIKILAKIQNTNMYWYGEKLLDLKPYDDTPIKIKTEIPELDIIMNTDDEFLNKLPPCIIKILSQKEFGTWKGRWLAVLYLKERGFPINIVEKICEKYFGKMPRDDNLRNNWEHMKKVRTVDLVFRRNDQVMPDCETLYRENWCPGKCKYHNKLYR